MKRSLLFIACIIFSCLACGQAFGPPKEVREAFAARYADARDVDWDKDDALWEVEFTTEKAERKAGFDDAGNWIFTESEVEKEELPPIVFKAIALKFEGFIIDEVEGFQDTAFNGFEITLERDLTEVEILISTEGDITIRDVKVSDIDL